MSTEDKLVAQHNAGVEADRELKQTGKGFDDLRAAYVKAWENSDPRDTAGREKIWLAMTILSGVQNALRSTLANGKVAEKELEALRKVGEPKRRFSIV